MSNSKPENTGISVESPRRVSSGRINREKRTIKAMIGIYCADHHDTTQPPCESCHQLLSYAEKRLQNCPFQDAKPACNNCQVHCYSKAKQTEIKQVMRYAGPRMLWRYPLLSLWHLLDTLREVPSLKKTRRTP